MKIKTSDITVERNKVNGSYILTTIVKGCYVSRVYYGYTKKECIAMFKDEFSS